MDTNEHGFYGMAKRLVATPVLSRAARKSMVENLLNAAIRQTNVPGFLMYFSRPAR